MNLTLQELLRAVFYAPYYAALSLGVAVQRTLKWVNAASPARFAEAIAAYFPGIDNSTLAGSRATTGLPDAGDWQ